MSTVQCGPIRQDRQGQAWQENVPCQKKYDRKHQPHQRWGLGHNQRSRDAGRAPADRPILEDPTRPSRARTTLSGERKRRSETLGSSDLRGWAAGQAEHLPTKASRGKQHAILRVPRQRRGHWCRSSGKSDGLI